MTTTGNPQAAAETLSAAKTEYYSVPGHPGVDPAQVALPDSEIATNDGRSSASVGEHSSPGLGNHYSRTPPSIPDYTLHADDGGRYFLRDALGVRYEIVSGATDGPASHTPEPVGPTHYSAAPGGDEELPDLELDINPDDLSTTQLGQLDAIRGHIGSLNSRMLATTAMVAEHQAATEQMQDTIQILRRDVLSRVDSLRNEVNSQRSRLNRVLDDNLRIVLETGVSNEKVSSILNQMNKNGGAHRVDRPPPVQISDPSIAARVPLPQGLQAAVNATVAPRMTGESLESFERRASAVLRTKEATLSAFPFPPVEGDPPAPPMGPRVAAFVPPPADRYLSVGSALCAHVRYEEPRARAGLQKARMLDEHDRRQRITTPVAMNNTASAYVTGTGREGRDILSEFADDAANSIREIIQSKVGTRIPLPSDDDHDVFVMTFLEKLLGWYRSNNYGGEDLDYYRVILLQNYLEGEAHRWYVTETQQYAKENAGDLPEFADIICAMHRRFVKSSSAQRATRAFNQVKWNAELGPEQLYTDLKDAGQRMVGMPALFVMKSRFMATLPDWVSKELRLHRGLTAEFSDYETLRSHTRQVWEINLAIKEERAESAKYRVQDHASSSTQYPRNSATRGDRGQTSSGQAHSPRDRQATGVQSSSSRDRQATPGSSRDQDANKGSRSSSGRAPEKKSCFACGGTDHFARDKVCPKYSETREHRPRAAAQYVMESYSDEDTDEYSALASEHSDRSGDEDPREAPDLDKLIACAEENDELVRVAAMRNDSSVRYFSMRISEDIKMSDAESLTTESSITYSIEGATTPGSSSRVGSELPFLLGNYNPGPVCAVCQECELVVRQVPATSENGFEDTQTYTVCEHLARIGQPRTPLEEGSTTVGAEVCAPSPELFEGYELNELGDPDFPLGIIINITAPMPVGCLSAQEEIQEFEESRDRAGLRPLTVLEYDANMKWLHKYRAYPEDTETERRLLDEQLSREVLGDPELGSRARAEALLSEVRLAKADEKRIAERGPDIAWALEPEQVIICEQLGDWSLVHEQHLRVMDRHRQAVITRGLTRRTLDWFE
ncbi:hypothetical protein B0H16DRAFT_1719862 [Mycena metata]|uniref:Retrotransposon gag domain-containing protein n=1 Tax=Mycena metata TaxID=1033252 RepID=A0AAD7J9U4_9AGAR|nr:hypothetical protein B0H16DRAFT_1719862 [Mycena metata]